MFINFNFNSLENKQYTSAVFLDSYINLKKSYFLSYYLFLNSYLKERFFAISLRAEISNISNFSWCTPWCSPIPHIVQYIHRRPAHSSWSISCRQKSYLLYTHQSFNSFGIITESSRPTISLVLPIAHKNIWNKINKYYFYLQTTTTSSSFLK